MALGWCAVMVQTKHSGCCCEECTRAQRLIRPANGGGNYARWLDAATEGLSDDESPSEAKRQVRGSFTMGIVREKVFVVPGRRSFWQCRGRVSLNSSAVALDFVTKRDEESVPRGSAQTAAGANAHNVQHRKCT